MAPQGKRELKRTDIHSFIQKPPFTKDALWCWHCFKVVGDAFIIRLLVLFSWCNTIHARFNNYCDKPKLSEQQEPCTSLEYILSQHPLTWPGATVGGHFRAVCNLTSFLSSSFPSAFFCWSVAPDHRKSTTEEVEQSQYFCLSEECRTNTVCFCEKTVWWDFSPFLRNRGREHRGKYGGLQLSIYDKVTEEKTRNYNKQLINRYLHKHKRTL